MNVTETRCAFMFKEGMGKERLVGNELREVNRARSRKVSWAIVKILGIILNTIRLHW